MIQPPVLFVVGVTFQLNADPSTNLTLYIVALLFKLLLSTGYKGVLFAAQLPPT